MTPIFLRSKIATFFVLVFSISSFGQNALISMTADRYAVHIQNNANHSLQINFDNSTSQLISPYDHMTVYGYFNRSKLGRKTIVCSYDQEAYESDIQKNQTTRANKEQSLLSQRKYAEQRSYEDLRNRLIAEAASNYNKNSDDWLSWGVRKLGNLGKFVYGVKTLVEEVLTLNFLSYEEVIEYYMQKHFNKNAVRAASRLLAQYNDLDEKPTAFVLGAALSYLVETATAEKKYDEGFLKIKEDYENRAQFLRALKNDHHFKRNHTYNALKLSPKSSNFKTKTPIVALSLEPFSFGKDLNQYWESAPDKLFVDENNDDQLEWGDGFFNTSFGGSFKIAVSPEMRLSQNRTSNARLYAGIAYYRAAYQLKGIDYSLTNSFFKTSPSNSPGFFLSSPMRYEQINLSGELACRFFIGNHVFFDLNGGYSKQTGIMNLQYSELSQGYSWTEDMLSITSEEYSPFYGAKIGIGQNKFHQGVHFSTGIQFYQVSLINTSDLKIYETGTDKTINFDSKGEFVYQVYVGVSFGF